MPSPLDTPQFVLPAGTYTPPSGSDRVMVVQIGAIGSNATQNAEPTTVSVTNDAGSPVTEDLVRADYALVAGGGNRAHLGVYYLVDADIPSGVLTLNVTYAQTPAAGVGAIIFTVAGRDQTTPIRDIDTLFRTSGDTSFDGAGVTTAIGDMVVASCLVGAAPTTVTGPSGYTELLQVNDTALSFRNFASFWDDEETDSLEDPVLTLSVSDQGAAAFFSIASASGDTTAPVLTSPTAGSVTSTSVTPSVTTDEANGTAYARVYANGATPTAAQVVSGTGVTPVASASSVSVGSTGAISFAAITGLTAGTDYELFFAHEDAAGNVSNASSVGFTTTALARTVALTSANNTEFRDRFGVVRANLEIDWEYYDQASSTEGASTDSGTVTLNGSGEATLTLTNSTAADGDTGTLVVFASSNSTILGVYQVTVSVS